MDPRRSADFRPDGREYRGAIVREPRADARLCCEMDGQREIESAVVPSITTGEPVIMRPRRTANLDEQDKAAHDGAGEDRQKRTMVSLSTRCDARDGTRPHSACDVLPARRATLATRHSTLDGQSRGCGAGYKLCLDLQPGGSIEALTLPCPGRERG